MKRTLYVEYDEDTEQVTITGEGWDDEFPCPTLVIAGRQEEWNHPWVFAEEIWTMTALAKVLNDVFDMAKDVAIEDDLDA